MGAIYTPPYKHRYILSWVKIKSAIDRFAFQNIKQTEIPHIHQNTGSMFYGKPTFRDARDANITL